VPACFAIFWLPHNPIFLLIITPNNEFSYTLLLPVGRNPNSFPGHQPEFDTAQAKGVYNDWNTTSSASYKDYSRRNMMQTQPCEQVPQVWLMSIYIVVVIDWLVTKVTAPQITGSVFSPLLLFHVHSFNARMRMTKDGLETYSDPD